MTLNKHLIAPLLLAAILLPAYLSVRSCRRTPVDKQARAAPGGPTGCAADSNPRYVSCEDLARWSRSGPQLGLGCLDDRIAAALDETAQRQHLPRDRVLLNPPPERVADDLRALPIYAVEIDDERPHLDWLRGVAMTVQVRLPHRATAPIVVVDRNLLRWMGTSVERFLVGVREAGDEMRRQVEGRSPLTRQPTVDLLRAMLDPAAGGFGKPVPRAIPAPQAISRYCGRDPSGQDVIVLSYLLDEVRWTLRHEMHHVSHPVKDVPWDKCPSGKEIENAALPHIEADRFATAQLDTDDLSAFLGPWRERVDAFVTRYGGPATLSVDGRLMVLARLLSHYEIDVVMHDQAYIASKRLKDLSQRLSQGAWTDELDLIRAMKAAAVCPGPEALARQCRLCPADESGCEQAKRLSWNCAFLNVEESAIQEQSARRDAMIERLRARGFRVTAHPESGPYLQLYRVERGGAPMGVGTLRGMLFPHENEDVNGVKEVGAQLGGPRHIAGFMVLPERSAYDPAVGEALLAWETEGHQRRCQAGDPHECRWLGMAYFKARGVPLNLKAARRAYRMGCDGGDQEGCVRLKEFRRVISD